jgi:hypothetical protein
MTTSWRSVSDDHCAIGTPVVAKPTVGVIRADIRARGPLREDDLGIVLTTRGGFPLASTDMDEAVTRGDPGGWPAGVHLCWARGLFVSS